MPRLPLVAVVILVLGSLLGPGACGRPAATSPPGTPSAPRSDQATPATVVLPASSAEQPEPGGDAVRTGSRSRSTAERNRGRVRCGEGWCQAVIETCCEYGDAAECTDSVPDSAADQGQPLGGQIRRCEAQVPARYALERLRRCDDSSDCSSRQMCCEMWLYSGAARHVCEPMAADARSVCDYSEVCVEGLPCRTEGTACVGGRCRKATAQRRCGNTTCSLSAPACCGQGDELGCRTEAGCKDIFPRYGCTHPSDCAPGEYCQLGIMGSECQGLLDSAHLRVVCEKLSDCPEDQHCAEAGKQTKCLADGWLRTCQCG